MGCGAEAHVSGVPGRNMDRRYGGDILLRKIIKKINYYLNFVSSFFLAFLMLMTVADVVSRKIFNVPIMGTYELTLLLITIVVYLGFAHSNDFKEHVVIDVLYEVLPQVGKFIFSIISSVLNLALACSMGYAIFRYIHRLRDSGAVTASLKIPEWPFAIVAFVGMVGLILSIIGDLILIIWERKVLSNDPS